MIRFKLVERLQKDLPKHISFSLLILPFSHFKKFTTESFQKKLKAQRAPESKKEHLANGLIF